MTESLFLLLSAGSFPRRRPPALARRRHPRRPRRGDARDRHLPPPRAPPAPAATAATPLDAAVLAPRDPSRPARVRRVPLHPHRRSAGLRPRADAVGPRARRRDSRWPFPNSGLARQQAVELRRPQRRRRTIDDRRRRLVPRAPPVVVRRVHAAVRRRPAELRLAAVDGPLRPRRLPPLLLARRRSAEPQRATAPSPPSSSSSSAGWSRSSRSASTSRWRDLDTPPTAPVGCAVLGNATCTPQVSERVPTAGT